MQVLKRPLPDAAERLVDDVETAVEAMRLGAYDFIEKPFEPQRLLEVIRHAIEKRRLVTENRRLRRAVNERGNTMVELLGAGLALVLLALLVALMVAIDAMLERKLKKLGMKDDEAE